MWMARECWLHLLQADGVQQGAAGAAFLGALGVDEGKGHLQQQQQQQRL
jgi:hypothetical protein